MVEGAREAIRGMLHGSDRERMLVIVGPCSLHDRDVALDYAERLARLAAATADELVVVMRAYFEKPRTRLGWKGILNDPYLDGSCDLVAGLRLARGLLWEITGNGVACGAEILDPNIPAYVGDLLSWAAIGARTSESQVHRQVASALEMPVGFKNSTDGRVEVAVDAMIAASQPHAFVGIGRDGRAQVMRSRGNPDCHVVLRGGRSPNYGPEQVAAAAGAAAEQGVERPILIDCSHGNSGKDPRRQGEVCRAALEQFAGGRREILGVMLESNLRAGRQVWTPGGSLEYGVSITDACIGWDETESLLWEMAKRLARLRRRGSLRAESPENPAAGPDRAVLAAG